MSRTKLILSGILAGALAFGTACKSNSAADRGEPMEPAPTQTPTENQGGTTPGTTNPGGTGGAGDQHQDSDVADDYTMPQEDRAGTGGTGYEDPVTHPDASDSSGSKQEPGTQEDSPEYQEDPQ
ncbi:MAG TPA: hypothetical protein VF794_05615 [Archangium sp.]|jgi:hypothetical protein|uniref:hypothetical protein n=1 Tax=Archangium sp. TaxID=1872627 RepID=UPI002ED86A6D